MEAADTRTGLNAGMIVASAKQQTNDKEDAKVKTPADHRPYHTANILDSA
jgi:hypothetical protein